MPSRLPLNVLLSFAQFEREVTGERIRDKTAASKRRGLWVGGNVPLGYCVENKKLVVVEEEAEQVRLIFRRYLELGSLGRLLVQLREQNLVTKRLMRDGVLIRGGIPFTRGPLAHLLHNRFYVGEIIFKGAMHAAEHPPIVDRQLFEAVQEKLAAQRVGTATKRGSSNALLIGKLFDDAGHRMTPSHANKGAVRYRYYVSAALVHGQKSSAGSVMRVRAPEIETIILDALKAAMKEPTADRELIDERLIRAVITPDRIRIEALADDEGGRCDLSIPWTPTRDRSRREVIRPMGQVDLRPMRPETREIMVRAIAQGRAWLDETIRDRSQDLERIAVREGCSRRQVAATISLAHLAPDIVEAALGGQLPHGISLRGLADLPMLWSQQRAALGLPSRWMLSSN